MKLIYRALRAPLDHFARSLMILMVVFSALGLSSNPIFANENDRNSSMANEDGLMTIESDTQSADSLTGVVTAIGNVRITYPARGMEATSRQVQYFSKEGRLVLSGDVDIVQNGGNSLRAERVVYLLDEERLIASPQAGGQVFSKMMIQSSESDGTPFAP